MFTLPANRQSEASWRDDEWQTGLFLLILLRVDGSSDSLHNVCEGDGTTLRVRIHFISVTVSIVGVVLVKKGELLFIALLKGTSGGDLFMLSSCLSRLRRSFHK